MAEQAGGQIDTVMHETRVFPPPAEFAAEARFKSLDDYQKLWDYAAADLQRFWAELARDELHWFKPFTKTLEWKEPFAEWFVGRQDQRVVQLPGSQPDRPGSANRTAILWEGEPGDTRSLTYSELHRDVCKFANVLKNLGIKAGDRVTIYMPMVPELVVAMLACAGSGRSTRWSSPASRPRRSPSGIAIRRRRLMITADASYRRGKVLPLKATVDEALAKSPSVEKCVVLDRVNEAVHIEAGTRLLVARADGDGVGRFPRSADGLRSAALHPLHQRLDRETQGHQAHDRRLQPLREEDVSVGVRSPRRRHLLVYGRLRLGHRAQLRRLRAAVGRCDDPDVRRRAESADRKSLLGADRKVQGDRALHRADRDSHVHQMGRPACDEARPVELATVGHGRRGDQSRGVDVVSPRDRRRAVPDRRHLVADRDGRHHDEPAAGRDRHQAGQLHQAAAGHRSRRSSTKRASRSARIRAAGS